MHNLVNLTNLTFTKQFWWPNYPKARLFNRDIFPSKYGNLEFYELYLTLIISVNMHSLKLTCLTLSKETLKEKFFRNTVR